MSWRVKIEQKFPEEYHFIHYLILVLILSLYVFFMFQFRHDSVMQIVTAGIGSVLYMVWGILHHYFEDRLTNLIAMEYILVSSFVFLLMLMVLYL